MRSMFQGKFDQVRIKLCSDDVRNLIEEFTHSRNVDVIEILPAERDYHGCTHILPTENHVYKISGKKVKKIDIFEALETGLLDYESNDYQFDSVKSLKMNNKLVVEVNCLLVNKETEKNAKIEYNIRTDKLSFDKTLNRLNLSSDDMLTMQKEVIESINEAIDSKFTLKAGDKYKIGFSSIRVPYYENSRDVGSFFVYDPDHLKIQEICKNLKGEAEIYELNQIHPMYFEKALKAFDFDTLKIDKQLAVKNKNVDFVNPILTALIEGKKIELEYCPFYESTPFVKVVKPLFIKEYLNRWYLITEKLDDRHPIFAFDRIKKYTILEAKFKKIHLSKNDNLKKDTYLLKLATIKLNLRESKNDALNDSIRFKLVNNAKELAIKINKDSYNC